MEFDELIISKGPIEIMAFILYHWVLLMKKYQLIVILKPDLKKDQKDKLFADVKKMMGDVEKDKVESLGEKRLSYPIKKERRAEFMVLNFEAENVAQDFNKRVGIKEEVLRHLLIRQ